MAEQAEEALSADPSQPLKLTAHAVARIADRVPFTRKLSRHMEGEEKRAGLLSDVVAVAYALWRRNPDAAETFMSNFSRELNARRAARVSTPNGAQPFQPTGVR